MNSRTTISPCAKHHPNLKGSEPRTRLAGGPFVDTTLTLAQFNTWAASGLSQGVIIDRLTAFALRSGFNPITETILPTRKKVNPRSPKRREG